MNALKRQSLATGAGLALAVCGGAWAAAQSQPQSQPAPTPTQPNTPAQTQQAPPAQPGTPASTSDSQTAPNGQSQSTAQPQQRTLQMVEVQAELQKTLDAKKDKQGAPVTAKLQNDVDIPNAQRLPKNTVLEGHVDQTQVSPDKHGTSSLSVTFDKAKLKDGQELPIKATVVAISQPANNMVPAQGAPPEGSPSMGGGGGAPSGGAPSGGGARGGGGSGSMSSGGGQSAPSTPSEPMPSAQSQTAGGSQGGQVPGVQLKSDIHQQTSATFLANGKNVHIPGGTQMEVAVTVIPPGTRLQQ